MIKNELSDHDKFNYFFIPAVISALLGFQAKEPHQEGILIHNIEHGIYSMLLIIITLYIFRKCKAARLGHRFFEFYFSLGLVSFIRAAIFFIPIALIFTIIFAASPSFYKSVEIYEDYASVGLIVLMAYCFLWSSFNRVIRKIE